MIHIFKENRFALNISCPSKLYASPALCAQVHFLGALLYFLCVINCDGFSFRILQTGWILNNSRLLQPGPMHLLPVFLPIYSPGFLFPPVPFSINSQHSSQRRLVKLKEQILILKSPSAFKQWFSNSWDLALLRTSGNVWEHYPDWVIGAGQEDTTSI